MYFGPIFTDLETFIGRATEKAIITKTRNFDPIVFFIINIFFAL
jgi:hypothetical protein